jgi:hypothetical protein
MNQEPVYRPHPEPVVLDIGGNVGALVVYAGADLIDTPVELSPTGDDDARSHQHVLERPAPDGTTYAAVFDKITEGSYTLWLHGQPRVRDFTINGARVAEVDWSITSDGDGDAD